jgi:hypothetical protein
LNRKTQAAAVRRLMEPIEASLEELRLAANRPFAQLEPSPLDDALPLPDPPHWPAYRLLARLFLVRASAELELGNTQGALRDLLVIQRMADALQGDRQIVSTTLRVALAQMCVEGFYEGWATDRWAEPELRQWESWFRTVDLLRDLDICLRGEEALRCNRGYDASAAAFQSFPILGPNWFHQQWLYNRLTFGFCEASFDQPRQLVHPSQMRAFQIKAAQMLREKAFWLLPPFPTPGRYASPERLLPHVAHAQTVVNLGRIVAALTRSRLDKGQAPVTLAELAPRYLPRVPHDLVGGKPLVYRPAADRSFRLYSVGWNERDDGGIPPPSSSELSQGDWVWPRATPPNKP